MITVNSLSGGKTSSYIAANYPADHNVFALVRIDDHIFKDQIVEYWKDKPVRFAYINNCIGCFHRNELLLKHMSERHPEKFDWFISQEEYPGYGRRTFKNGVTYRQIKESNLQAQLFDDDFNECDSGYCGM